MKEHERVTELKQLKKLAHAFLDFYIAESQKGGKGWENDLIKRNISLLKKIISRINLNQHPDKVSGYVQSIEYKPEIKDIPSKEEQQTAFNMYGKHLTNVMGQGTNLFLLMEIVKCSPKISYHNDFTWFTHGNIDEHIKFGLGSADETIFEKYLPNQLSYCRELEKTFFKKESFEEDAILLKSILVLIENESFVPANILTITLIEGLVRKFSFLVYKKQNPSKSFEEIDNIIYNGNLSFERLITDIEWEKDIPLKISELLTQYSHSENETIYKTEEKRNLNVEANISLKKKISELDTLISDNLEEKKITDEELTEKAKTIFEDMKSIGGNLMTEEDKTVFISLSVYLDFLVRKFKDDRNSIIHGRYSQFNAKWTSLVYLTALETLVKKIIWYDEHVLVEAHSQKIHS